MARSALQLRSNPDPQPLRQGEDRQESSCQDGQGERTASVRPKKKKKKKSSPVQNNNEKPSDDNGGCLGTSLSVSRDFQRRNQGGDAGLAAISCIPSLLKADRRAVLKECDEVRRLGQVPCSHSHQV